MANIEGTRRTLSTRLVEGAGHASPSRRATAFRAEKGDLPPTVSALLEKVATRAQEVSDDDVRGAIAAGLTEDELFELVVCAAVGECSREHELALAALDAATKGA